MPPIFGVWYRSEEIAPQAAKLCNLMLKHNMIQQVDQATRGREILDLIFTNKPIIHQET